MAKIRYIIPSLVTMVGGVVGCLAIQRWSIALATLSLLCDIADGRLARRLHAATEIGARLDWSVDVALAHAAIWAYFQQPIAAILSMSLAAWQSVSMDILPMRTSGRAIVWIGIFALEAVRW